jgi:pyruvate kinase
VIILRSTSNKLINSNEITIDSALFLQIKVGDRAYTGDGELVFQVVERNKSNEIVLIALNDWFISDSKAFGVFGKSSIIGITDVNLEKLIKLVLRWLPDSVCLSFVESKGELEEIKSKLPETIKIGAKIETHMGVEKIDEIAGFSDFIIIARGDLALNINILDFRSAQSNIIKAANLRQTPVIVATDVFTSLISKNFPLRSEISDFFGLKEDIRQGGFLLTKESSISSLSMKRVVSFISPFI